MNFTQRGALGAILATILSAAACGDEPKAVATSAQSNVTPVPIKCISGTVSFAPGSIYGPLESCRPSR